MYNTVALTQTAKDPKYIIFIDKTNVYKLLDGHLN